MTKVKIISGLKREKPVITEEDFQYVEGGVWDDGRITFHIETTDHEIHLEFANEQEFKERFFDSLREQIEEDKKLLLKKKSK